MKPGGSNPHSENFSIIPKYSPKIAVLGLWNPEFSHSLRKLLQYSQKLPKNPSTLSIKPRGSIPHSENFSVDGISRFNPAFPKNSPKIPLLGLWYPEVEPAFPKNLQ